MCEQDINTTITELMNLYGNDILRLCFLYVKDYHLAEDITQETFIKVYQKLDTFKNQSSIKTWITRIAINGCKNALSRAIKEITSIEDIIIPYNEDFSKNENTQLLSEEVSKLPKKYFEVIMLFYYQELSIKEISYVLKIPQSTVKTRLKRAKERLKSNLEEEFFYD
jgi:RNA polymerase sigma-70 factor (ECF subfamily)